jgi:uncharacterized Zn-binding protein involved in type VI secretion
VPSASLLFRTIVAGEHLGQPAARLTDMHVCPMFDGPVPHVGGPVVAPCDPMVLIGGLPAARVTDMLVCCGPPDMIVQGSPTVLIGGLMAARLGDMTAHGGVIVVGDPTVLIGDGAGGDSDSDDDDDDDDDSDGGGDDSDDDSDSDDSGDDDDGAGDAGSGAGAAASADAGGGSGAGPSSGNTQSAGSGQSAGAGQSGGSGQSAGGGQGSGAGQSAGTGQIAGAGQSASAGQGAGAGPNSGSGQNAGAPRTASTGRAQRFGGDALLAGAIGLEAIGTPASALGDLYHDLAGKDLPPRVTAALGIIDPFAKAAESAVVAVGKSALRALASDQPLDEIGPRLATASSNSFKYGLQDFIQNAAKLSLSGLGSSAGIGALAQVAGAVYTDTRTPGKVSTKQFAQDVTTAAVKGAVEGVMDTMIISSFTTLAGPAAPVGFIAGVVVSTVANHIVDPIITGAMNSIYQAL